MEFKKFTSLINHYREADIEKIKNSGYQGQWVVAEKLDGANFSFYYNGKDLRVASRNQFTTGEFFRSHDVIEQHSEGVKNFYKDMGFTGEIIVTGELFGQGILDRVKYGSKRFVAFDLIVDGEPQSRDRLLYLKGYVPVVGALGIYGSLQDALDHPESFKSFYTPEGFEGDNFAEGTVISPYDPLTVYDVGRVIIKKKSKEFLEVADKPRKNKGEVKELDESTKQVLESLSLYATESRLYSVLSKFGGVEYKDFGEVLGIFVNDCIVEWGGEVNKDVKREFTRVCSSVIRLPFLKAVEGSK